MPAYNSSLRRAQARASPETRLADRTRTSRDSVTHASTGYSGTPLAQKLGIKAGTVVLAIGAPKNFPVLLAPLPRGARVTTRATTSPAFVHVFATARSDLASRLASLRESLQPDGTLWVSWPKKASGVATDITEEVIRAVALPLGFVDVKVCAVDDTWSGLKLVVRKALRPR
jgi:hypothetical protein